jgi:stage V sporulation protein SpoVS
MDEPFDSTVNDAGLPIFKVSGRTVPLALANAIARVLREHDSLELHTIGAGAVYRAVTALAIARILLAADGIDLGFMPHFGEIAGDEEITVGIIFDVEYRSPVE